MYLLAKKYGLDRIADNYLYAFTEMLCGDMTTSEYALCVAEFCGPSAPARYADTELSGRMFTGILEEARSLIDENEIFCKMLEEGTLFSPRFAGRFTMQMVEMFRDAERASQ